MSKEILINSGLREVRAAVIDNGEFSEFFIERINKKSAAGNIYKGKVVKVLPGMQSAFVEIGLQRAAFLHVADIDGCIDRSEQDFIDDDNYEDHLTEFTPVYKPIEDYLKEGQEIVVQVTKDAIAAKGARLTTHLTIPGRYIVLMPSYEHIGVSRKIESDKERERLKEILLEIRPEGMGLIARTVSDGVDRKELEEDLKYLKTVWASVSKNIEEKSAPSLVYLDHNLIFKILRDVVTHDTSRIIIDKKEDYINMQEFLKDNLSSLDISIEYYDKDEPLFDLYNIETEVNKLFDKKVWLSSGGSIVIDRAEALTVIDVNTGKYVGKENFNDTILETNLEAAKEIAHQLKMRNIGGIIIVDFIDMERLEDRELVLSTLDKYLKTDRAKSSVVNLSPLGLVEITRKRVRESISRMMGEACPFCEGRGIIKSKITVAYEIMRQLEKLAAGKKNAAFLIEAHHEIISLLLNNEKEAIEYIESFYHVSIKTAANESVLYDRYKIKIVGYI